MQIVYVSILLWNLHRQVSNIKQKKVQYKSMYILRMCNDKMLIVLKQSDFDNSLDVKLSQSLNTLTSLSRASFWYICFFQLLSFIGGGGDSLLVWVIWVRQSTFIKETFEDQLQNVFYYNFNDLFQFDITYGIIIQVYVCHLKYNSGTSQK